RPAVCARAGRRAPDPDALLAAPTDRGSRPSPFRRGAEIHALRAARARPRPARPRHAHPLPAYPRHRRTADRARFRALPLFPLVLQAADRPGSDAQPPWWLPSAVLPRKIPAPVARARDRGPPPRALRPGAPRGRRLRPPPPPSARLGPRESRLPRA